MQKTGPRFKNCEGVTSSRSVTPRDSQPYTTCKGFWSQWDLCIGGDFEIVNLRPLTLICSFIILSEIAFRDVMDFLKIFLISTDTPCWGFDLFRDSSIKMVICAEIFWPPSFCFCFCNQSGIYFWLGYNFT